MLISTLQPGYSKLFTSGCTANTSAQFGFEVFKHKWDQGGENGRKAVKGHLKDAQVYINNVERFIHISCIAKLSHYQL